MSVKCKEPLDEPTVQIGLLYHHPNFKYCTLFVSRSELGTDKQMDGQTDRQMIIFQAGGIRIEAMSTMVHWLWPRFKVFVHMVAKANRDMVVLQ